MRSSTAKVIVSVVLIGGSASYLLADTLLSDAEALTYFHPADEVIIKGQTLAGQKIRMGGFVVKDSIFHKPGTLEYQFEVRPVPEMAKHKEALTKTITVRYAGIVPDTFKDDAEVIVAGAVQPDGSFKAQELVAKCPSKYEATEKNAGSY